MQKPMSVQSMYMDLCSANAMQQRGISCDVLYIVYLPLCVRVQKTFPITMVWDPYILKRASKASGQFNVRPLFCILRI